MSEWDEAKSQDNLEKRGFDFEYAARIFKGEDLLEYEDRRRHYGERRIVAIGEVEGQILFVVYTWRRRQAPDHFSPSCQPEGTQCVSSDVRQVKSVKAR